MKRVAVWLPLVGLLFVAAIAVGSHDPGNRSQSPRDFASGGGQILSGPHRFGFNAHSGSLGENAGGKYSTNIPHVGQLTFDVECLRVDGNEATLAGPIRNSTGVFEGRDNAKSTVVDNGRPHGAMPDLMQIATEVGTDCNTPAPGGGAVHPVTKGNVVVHDAQP
jgi:hypothetical protein